MRNFLTSDIFMLTLCIFLCSACSIECHLSYHMTHRNSVFRAFRWEPIFSNAVQKPDAISISQWYLSGSVKSMAPVIMEAVTPVYSEAK